MSDVLLPKRAYENENGIETNKRTRISVAAWEEIANQMKQNAQNCEPLSTAEIDMVVQSLRNVADRDCDNVNWDGLSSLLREVAHLSHKNWTRTGVNAALLHEIILPGETSDVRQSAASQFVNVPNPGERAMSLQGSRLERPGGVSFRSQFDRVLHDGNWDGAVRCRKEASDKGIGSGEAEVRSVEDTRPWIVLITGVNGIRKSTSVYAPWFQTLLSQALVAPDGSEGSKNTPLSRLPSGTNSFFRQLDHMIAILANEEFKRLYQITSDVVLYATYKDGIFARYRTLSEMLGVVLVREAQKEGINVLVETSGRDLAMFEYVDTFFDSDQYRKLVLRYTINDVAHAERSVDRRMMEEMKNGREALKKKDIRSIIKANAGGPYGSKVLKQVKTDSDRVWKEVCEGSKDVVSGSGWYKATIEIRGHESDPWTATAIRTDGTRGVTFEFPNGK